MSHVLIVDDEPSICWALRECLSDEGFSVDVAGTAEQAFSLADQRAPDVIVMDVRLPGMDGMKAMRQLRDKSTAVPIIIMTAFGSLKTAVEAIDGGAFDYLTKPMDLDKAVAVVRQAVTTTSKAGPTVAEIDDALIVGSSPKMQEVFRRIALVAERDVPVLITGESGTGKDLVARAIHQHSRRKGSFVPICIPALSESVIESELFGHSRAAFTGADKERSGLLELANGGTSFIDEIGDVSLNLQAKLLRVLETGELRPVGSNDCRMASFRLIAATHRSLEQRVSSGEFRGDLFFRLNVFRIEVPRLRDRLDDLPALVQRFLMNCPHGGRVLRMSDEALDELRKRPWHGNVRELRNVVESASVVCRGDTILPHHLSDPTPLLTLQTANRSADPMARLSSAIHEWSSAQLSIPSATVDDLYDRFLKAAEPALLGTALEHAGGQRGEAARILGIHRETLRDKLRRFEGDSK
ncbi:MAG: sigma-54 dependent transcriptional regulator [Planctomycetaceae bacterium]